MVSFLRRMLWFFTPAKSIVVENVTPELSITEERPSPYLSQMGHLTLGLIYSVMLVGYCALLIVNWVNRDSFTEYTTKPVTKYDPMWIQLEVYCTNAPNCGQIRIRQNYDGVGGLPAGCTTADDVVVYNTAPGNTEGKVLVPLCWSDNPLFSTKNFPLNIPGITISFTEINPGRTSKYDNTPNPHFFAQGVIKIYDRTGPGAAPLPESDKRPLRTVNVDTHQVKTALIGQEVTDEYDEVTKREGVPEGIQYDGKHPGWPGTVIVAVQEEAAVTRTWRKGLITFLDGLSSMAMAAWIIFVFMLFLIPIWPKFFPGPAQQVINENVKRRKQERMPVEDDGEVKGL